MAKKKAPTANDDQKPKNVIEKRQPGTDVVGYMSRVDAGSRGYRKGLLLQTYERAKENNVDCIYLVGGLVSKRGVNEEIRRIKEEEKRVYEEAKRELNQVTSALAELVSRIKSEKNEAEKKKLDEQADKLRQSVEDAKEKVKSVKPRKPSALLDEFVEQLAQELNEDLPEFEKSDGKKIRLYIVTSPALDGLVGHRVASRLVELRNGKRNIVYFGQTHARIDLKKSRQVIVLLTPEKAVWRSKNYSAYPDRLVEDYIQKSSKKADMFVIGGFASSIKRGKGSNPYERISVPACCKPEESSTVENMVGFKIVRYAPEGKPNQIVTFDFKHFTTRERETIVAPPQSSKTQIKIIDDIKQHGSRSIGQLEDDLEIPRDKLAKAIKGLLNRTKAKAGLVFDEKSRLYTFNDHWMKKVLRYSWPDKTSGWSKDTVIGFACMHAGSVHTAYNFIVKEIPKIVVAEEADVLFDAGDSIEGLKHELAKRKEVYGGFNYTDQEQLCALMVSTIMLKAFEERLNKALKDRDVKKITQEEVKKFLDDLLVTFIFICGNHDDWEKDLGFNPLTVFELMLRDKLLVGLERILVSKGLPLISLREFANKKVLRFEPESVYKFPSGITLSGIHYHAGRTATNSVWPQRALAQFKSHIQLVGNFHVEEEVEEYDSELGLRVAHMLPTLKSMSDFERNKGKIVDFGVGLIRVWSYKGRILVCENGLRGQNPHESLDANAIFKQHCKDIGVIE